MAKKKNKKVVRYRRPLNINVGMIIFFIIFIYLVFSVYTYLKREKIQFYEVVDGGIVNNRIYNGLILREEQVRTADRSGYINYYLREGKRASVGSRIYSLDETGNLEALLKENAEEGSSLSDDSLSDLKKQLTSFVLSFQNQDFGTIYDARISLDASVMEYSSFSTLDQLDKLAEQSGAVFEQVRSDGICREVNYMEKNKKENTNNLISRIKARANAGKNTEEKKSPDSLILRIKRRANADKNKERDR